MILNTFIKQPSEVKDYDIDYSSWLTPMVDTISGAEVTAVCTTDPADTSLAVQSTQLMPEKIKVWIAGGTAGKNYKVTIVMTTNGGRVDESELIFKVKEI